jgi:hypothetical protein
MLGLQELERLRGRMDIVGVDAEMLRTQASD